MTARSIGYRTKSANRMAVPWRKHGTAYLFMLPTLILYAIFVLYPFVASFALSLTDWNGADAVRTFVGAENYRRLLQDNILQTALTHNLIWMVVGSAGGIGLGFLLALLVWSRPRGFVLFRTVFFLPQVLGAAVVGIIWKLIYRPYKGMLYEIGDALDIPLLRYPFLGETATALGAILAAAIWAGAGFFFVILLAGLQNVDRDLIDAARIDGASGLQRLRHVVIPQISPILTFVLILAMIGSLNVFDIVWAMTEGGPANSTEVIGTYSYTKAFLESNVGYAAALTMVMTGLAITVSIVLIRIRTRQEI